MKRIWVWMPLFLLLGSSCKNKTSENNASSTEDPSLAQGQESAAAASEVVAEVTTPPAPKDGAALQTMAHCPSAVEGATTVASLKDGKAMIVVSAADESSIKEIRKRSVYLQELSEPPAARQHNGEGHGGGEAGRCPIVPGTIREVSDHPQGVRIFVDTKQKPAQELVTMANKRAESLNRAKPARSAEAGAKTGAFLEKARKSQEKTTGDTTHGSGKGGGNGKGGGKDRGVRGLPKKAE